MALPKALTLAEFMVWESEQDGKNEFEQGRVVPRTVGMAGGAAKHSLVGANIVGALFGKLKGSNCRAYNSDLLILSDEYDCAFYPDATIVCGPPEIERYGKMQATKNPAVVFEVLSTSTEGRDRGFKKEVYASIPSVREIVLIDTSKAHVERYVRDEKGWRWEATVGLATSVRILDMDLPLEEIYDGVVFGEELE